MSDTMMETRTRIWIERGPCYEDWPDPADCRLLVDVESLKRGRFKPDPDSIQRYCFTHEVRMSYIVLEEWAGCYLFLWMKATDNEDELDPCDPGWVARPVRLEVVGDE